MSFNPETGQMDWRDESSWMLISAGSGILLSMWYSHRQQFPNAHPVAVVGVSCLAFYVLSILLRIQNQRAKSLIGRPGFDEKKLKYIFPALGMGMGMAIALW